MIFAIFYALPALAFLTPLLILTFLVLPKKQKKLITQNIDFTILSLYALLIIIFIQPYHGFKVFSLSLLAYVQILVPATILVFFIVHLARKLYKRALILLLITVPLFIFGYYSNYARQYILDQTLNAFYCREELDYLQEVLGGIKVMGYNQSHKNQFYNDTHCLITVCHEEHYGCDKPADILAPQ